MQTHTTPSGKGYTSSQWAAQKTPTLSIILPAYNTGDFMAQTLDALSRAHEHGAELIIVHDGGQDDTLEVALAWAQAHENLAVLIIDQAHAGLAAARHTGLQYARGQYLAFCDGDAFLDLGTYAEMVQLGQTQNCEMVVCRAVVFDNLTGQMRDFDDASVFDALVQDQKSVVTSWAKSPQLFSLEPHANLRILQREFFFRAGLKFTTGRFHEDIDPHVSALCQARHVGLLNRTGLFSRVGHPGAFSRQAGMQRFDVLHGVQAALASAQATGLSAEAQAAMLSMLLRTVFGCGQQVPYSERANFVNQANQVLAGHITPQAIEQGLRQHFRTRREALLALAFHDQETRLIRRRLDNERWYLHGSALRFLWRHRNAIHQGLQRLR